VKLGPDLRGQRLDRAVTRALQAEGQSVSVREVRTALKSGQIQIDGRRRPPGDCAQGGESVHLNDFVPRAHAQLRPDTERGAQVEVLFEDGELLVLHKPSGWATQPLRPQESNTLLHAAVALAPQIAHAGPPLEGGLVHRLDRGTSGVVIFAKTASVRSALRHDFRAHRIQKQYLALAQGSLPDRVTVDVAIGPGSSKDRVRPYDQEEPGGQPAQTEIEVLERLQDNLLWVRACTRFGRRHQVRLHLCHSGAPIVGDETYGDGPKPWLTRLGLHAARVTLPDGRSFEAPVPEDLQHALRGQGASLSVSP